MATTSVTMVAREAPPVRAESGLAAATGFRPARAATTLRLRTPAARQGDAVALHENQCTLGEQLAQLVRELGTFLLVQAELAGEGGVVDRAVSRLAEPGEEAVAKFHGDGWELTDGWAGGPQPRS